MKKTNPSPQHFNRIRSLDGLRGIAILLVILNHLRLSHLYDIVPLGLHPLLSSFLNSGKVGVSILFLLSGFLMARYYPKIPSKIAFLQKRYTRIVPAFFAMSSALALIRYFWNMLSPLLIILIILASATIFGLIWKIIQKNPKRRNLGVALFLIYGIGQLIVLIGYILLQMSVPPAIYYQIWAGGIRQIVVFLVNAFMINPFGIYVPPLDGAYWSIATELVFYLLYPVFFLPVIKKLIDKRSPMLIFMSIMLCFPFFYGIYLLFSSILFFSMFNMYLAIYFVFGVGMGLAYRPSRSFLLIDSTSRVASGFLVVVATLIVCGLPLFRYFINVGAVNDLLIWVLPISFVLLLTLRDNLWSSLLQTKALVLLGRISFSLYLVHTISIEMIEKLIVPDTLSGMSIQAILSIIIMMILATVLYFFLERPYFTNKLQSQDRIKIAIPAFNVFRPTLVVFVSFMLLVWYGFSVPAPLTSRVVSHDLSLAHFVPIQAKPVVFKFVGKYPNLGMMFFNVKILDDNEAKSLKLKSGAETDESLSAKIQDEGGKILSNNTFALYQMHDTRFHPIGLPIQPNSKGKRYSITFSAPDKALEKLAIVNNGSSFRTVYMQSKSDLITHPSLIFETIFERFAQPFEEVGALQVLLLSLPLWGLIIFQTTTERKGA